MRKFLRQVRLCRYFWVLLAYTVLSPEHRQARSPYGDSHLRTLTRPAPHVGTPERDPRAGAPVAPAGEWRPAPGQ